MHHSQPKTEETPLDLRPDQRIPEPLFSPPTMITNSFRRLNHGAGELETLRLLPPKLFPSLIDDFLTGTITREITQIGDLALLPKTGKAIFVSDLEGQVDLFAKIIARTDLINRIASPSPEDRLTLCILGDTVNKGHHALQILETLLNLRSNPLFARQIIILPGNHELEISRQLQEDKLGFYHEIKNTPYCWGRSEREEFLQSGELLAGATLQIPSAVSQETDKIIRKAQAHLLRTLAKPKDLKNGHLLLCAQRILWLKYNAYFANLPKAIVSPSGIYAAHAGYPTAHMRTDALKKHYRDSSLDQQLLELASMSLQKTKTVHRLNGSITNSVLLPQSSHDELSYSDTSPKFNNRSLNYYLESISASIMIRGHQKKIPERSNKLSNGAWESEKSITINTAIDGSYLEVDLAELKPQLGRGITLRSGLDK